MGSQFNKLSNTVQQQMHHISVASVQYKCISTKQQHLLLSAYVDTSGTKFFIDKSTPMGICFCMQLNLMCDSRL